MENQEVLSHDDLLLAVDHCFEAQLKGGVGSATIPILFGAPGVGKTQLYKNYVEWKRLRGSKALNVRNPKVFLFSIILAASDSVDIGGAIAPDFDKGELRHMPMKDILGYIKGAEDADIIVIFTDELGNAGPMEISAIQSYFEDGEIRGNKKLPHVVICAASNLPEHGCNAKPIPRSLMEGRLVSFYMDVNHEGWLRWAAEKGIDHRIIAAIRWREELLYSFDGKHKGRTQATPRGWEKLSNLMDTGADGVVLDGLAEGCVGPEAWMQARGFFRMASTLPFFEDIVSDPEGTVLPGDHIPSEGPGGQWVTVSNIAYRLSQMKRRGEYLETSVSENIIKYMDRMSDEIALYGLRLCGDANAEFKLNGEYSNMQIKHEDLK